MSRPPLRPLDPFRENGIPGLLIGHDTRRLETFVFFVEMITVMVITHVLLEVKSPCIGLLTPKFLVAVVQTGCTIFYFCIRYAPNFHVLISEFLAHHLRLERPSKLALFASSAQLLCVAAFWLAPSLFLGPGARSPLSVDNFMESHPQHHGGDPFLSPCKAADMLLFAPLREEFLFRVVVLQLFLNRCSPLVAAFGSASWFALLHAANLDHQSFHNSYVLVQMAAAFLVGLFLALHTVRRANALDALLIHICNNAAASLLPTSTNVAEDPVARSSLLQTALFYLCLVLWTGFRIVANRERVTSLSCASPPTDAVDGGDSRAPPSYSVAPGTHVKAE